MTNLRDILYYNTRGFNLAIVKTRMLRFADGFFFLLNRQCFMILCTDTVQRNQYVYC